MVEQELICHYSDLPSPLYYLELQKDDNPSKINTFSDIECNRIIEMAWEDRTPFEAIEFQFHIKEKHVIEIMRKNLLPPSFKRWRKRVTNRKTKHAKLRLSNVIRFKCSRQKHMGNRI